MPVSVTVAVPELATPAPLPPAAALIQRAKASLTRGLTVAQRDAFGLAVPPDAPADRNAVPPPPR